MVIYKGREGEFLMLFQFIQISVTLNHINY